MHGLCVTVAVGVAVLIASNSLVRASGASGWLGRGAIAYHLHIRWRLANQYAWCHPSGAYHALRQRHGKEQGTAVVHEFQRKTSWLMAGKHAQPAAVCAREA